jgi:hypothetical protein
MNDVARFPDLRISGIFIKYVIGNFACNGIPCYDEAVDIEGVDNKWTASNVLEQFRHAVKVDQQGQESLACHRAIFGYP